MHLTDDDCHSVSITCHISLVTMSNDNEYNYSPRLSESSQYESDYPINDSFNQSREDDLLEVLQYSDVDLNRMRQEAIDREQQTLYNAELNLKEETLKLEEWFEKEMGKTRSNGSQAIKSIDNEIDLISQQIENEADNEFELIQEKQTQLAEKTIESEHLQEEVTTLKLKIQQKHSDNENLIDQYDLKKSELEHNQHLRDLATRDYETVTASFAELHSQYNDLKNISTELQETENIYLKEIKAREYNKQQWTQRYNLVKKTTEDEIKRANSMFNSMSTKQEHDKKILTSEIKSLELQIASERETLQSKKHNNEELHKICTELMNLSP